MATGILVILDDVLTMTQVAAKKTAGVLGDDLAVNAEKATGFAASRELPVIWAITKGSFINKLIILPIAFLLSAFVPWLIVPILLIGGAYLCYEGAEKVMEWLFPHKHEPIAAEESDDPAEILAQEAGKIKAAIRTDFILSIEIIVIALGTVMDQSLLVRSIVVAAIAVLATIGVYGLVAMLVRMDDAGFHLIERATGRKDSAAKTMEIIGRMLVASLPKVIALLAVVGTIAMLLVGGGMYVHNIEVVHHALGFMPTIVSDLVAGMVVGGAILGLFKLKSMVFSKSGSGAE